MKNPALDLAESSLSARVRMVAARLRLGLGRDPGARPVKAALSRAARGRVSRAERAWIDRIEARRLALQSDEATTALPEFARAGGDGGSFSMSGPETSMGMASVVMSLSPHWALLLMLIVRECRPSSCLELGTGFGISAAYQGAALELNRAGTLSTLEGAREWAERAAAGFGDLGLSRIEQRVGPIEETLPDEAARRAPLDLVFVDAEHEGEATLAHFHTLLPHLADGAILLFDDIGWPGVRWGHRRIAENDRVSTSAELGRLAVTVIGGGRRG